MKILGHHLLIEYYGCDAQVINDKEIVRNAMFTAARLASATIITDIFHTFSPYGISGVIVLSESHFAIHTWPEYCCASVDFFSCSDKLHLTTAMNFLRETFHATKVTHKQLSRGRIQKVPT